MKRWSIFILVVPVCLSAVSYGEISFGLNPYIHPNSLDFDVDYDSLQPDGYILEISQNALTINPLWHHFAWPAGISCDLWKGDFFVTEYISPGNYQTGEIGSLADHFDLKESFNGYAWNGSVVYDSNRGSFYINEYENGTLNRFTINGFDGYTYEKSYDLNSLISEIYMVILIGLLVFSAIRMKMRFRSA
jgi:hypothetical protein